MFRMQNRKPDDRESFKTDFSRPKNQGESETSFLESGSKTQQKVVIYRTARIVAKGGDGNG